MSEIELLYKNAGVKFIIGVQCRAKKGDGCKSRCPDCDYNTKPKEYPPFTAEKQIEMIKWLVQTRPIHINFLIDKWVIEGIVRYGKQYDTFDDALSGYINQIWQDLTEEEQEQIKKILEE